LTLRASITEREFLDIVGRINYPFYSASFAFVDRVDAYGTAKGSSSILLFRPGILIEFLMTSGKNNFIHFTIRVIFDGANQHPLSLLGGWVHYTFQNIVQQDGFNVP
jgi:hypothetical protein